ncbi:class I SAM-dependent methyltransferase [Acidobacteriota bacterium]
MMNLKNFIVFVLLVLMTSPNFPSRLYSNLDQDVRVEEWEKRINETRQPPEHVMNSVGVKQGMIIGEVGAGRGRYTVHLANRVGNSGKVYANDINKNALSYLQNRCIRDSIHNIETILGKVDDPLFPDKALDMVFMVWVYHMLEQPISLLKNLRTSLKKGATVVIIDPPDEEIDAEIKSMKGSLDPNRPTIKQRIENGASEAGFKIVRIETFLPKDSIYILELRDKQ